MKRFLCHICDRPFARKTQLTEHILSHSGVCQQRKEQPPAKKPRQSNDVTFIEKNVSRFRTVQCLTLSTSLTFNDLWTLYKQSKESLRHTVLTSLSQLQVLKFDLILHITFHKATDPEETIACYFHSKAQMLSSQRQATHLILEAFKGVNKQVEDYLERGSGWVVETINNLDVHITKSHRIKGSTYLPLPNKLLDRKAIINIKNTDNRCFMWSLLAALHPASKNANQVSHYKPYASSLNFDGIDFPVKIDDVAQFEKQNSLSINIYGYSDDEDQLKILHLTENDAPKQISLLLYNNQHYCWIKDVERFLNANTMRITRQFQCHRCLCLFYSLEKRDKHVDRCKNPDLESVEMPEDSSFKFTNYHRMQRLPYVMYADFECLLEKVNTCNHKPSTSYTTAYQKHTPCGCGIAEIFECCSDDIKLGETFVYRGDEPVKKFLDNVIEWGERYQDIYNQQVKMIMTEQHKWQFHGSTICNICQKRLNDDRVADHCHFCGSYRGACHSQCNLKYRLSREVVVVKHNLRRYDGHLLMEQLGHVISQRKGAQISVIPKGFDDYLTFSLRLRYNKCGWLLKFSDSYQFLSASLAKLVDNLMDKGQDTFQLMASRFNQQQQSILLRKGVYPYDYMDNWSRFDEIQLPSRDQFASSLSGEEISEADYNHTQNVWTTFNLTNLGQYHDLYLLTDVLLLADIFESFRLFCLQNYQLDPAHYFTSPSFSWDACLKYTIVEMELLTDPEMYTFMEAGIRGGISIITHRYAKANNPLRPGYDSTTPTSFIMYYDANNLYGNTMIMPLPIGQFHWLDDVNIDVTQISDDAEEGYILEVDLQYPDHLHTAHNDYLLAPERLEVTDAMLSPYCSALKTELKLANAKVEKLIPNLCNKQRYIVHYRNLKLYLSLGLELKTIHRVLVFKQKTWMAPYIQFNTEMRKKATSAFEKDLFKLFNNSVFGKTMENVRKYIDIKLVCNEEKVVKLASQLEYSGFKI